MTEQEQIEEMIAVMAASNDPFVDVPIEIMPQIAKALYNEGYRKTFAVDFATDTQKVSKLEAENKYLLKLIESEYFSYQTTSGKKYNFF